MLGLMDRRPNRVTRLGEGVLGKVSKGKQEGPFRGGEGAGVGKKGKNGQLVRPSKW